MIYLDNAQALIEWNEQDKYAVLQWRGYADGEEYRGVLNTLLNAIVEHSSTRLLSDTRKMKVVTQEDQAWVTSDWAPRATAAGMRWYAILVPTSALAKLSLQRMVGTTGPGTTGGGSKYFDDIEEARKWLRSTR